MRNQYFYDFYLFDECIVETERIVIASLEIF